MSEKNHQTLPDRIIAFFVRCMPADRREWGRAMQAELTQIANPLERWRFALGCVRVAIFPPRSTSPRSTVRRPGVAALTGLLFLLPFLVANVIVGERIEPFFSLIRPKQHTSPQEYLLLFVVLFLIPVGAFSALRPLLQKGADGRRKFYAWNGVTAALLLMVFAALSIGLGSDIYRCDVLGIPNCD